MYQLYYTRQSAAMSSHAVLEEIGAPYEAHLVDLSQPRSAAFLRLNPNGTVPVLIDRPDRGGEPFVLYQSAAILLYLAERHPEAGLLPPAGSRERARVYQWLFFSAERLMATYLGYFYPERVSEDPAHHDAIRALAVRQIGEIWERLDTALDPGPWFLGEARSLCDYFIYTFAVWQGPDHVPLDRFPHVSRTLAALEARPAIQAMRRVQVDAAA